MNLYQTFFSFSQVFCSCSYPAEKQKFPDVPNINRILDCDCSGGAVYLGNLNAATSVHALRKKNIGAVLTVSEGTTINYSLEDEISHCVVNADDS